MCYKGKDNFNTNTLRVLFVVFFCAFMCWSNWSINWLHSSIDNPGYRSLLLCVCAFCPLQIWSRWQSFSSLGPREPPGAAWSILRPIALVEDSTTSATKDVCSVSGGRHWSLKIHYAVFFLASSLTRKVKGSDKVSLLHYTCIINQYEKAQRKKVDFGGLSGLSPHLLVVFRVT